jgi:hypothetical protein
MTDRSLPETTIHASLKRDIDTLTAAYASVEDAERVALTTGLLGPLGGTQRWREFSNLVRSTILRRGYIVVRGLDPDDGRSLLVVGAAFGAAFDTYGGRRIVKRFRMSPWTNELSHTIRAGDFHTDGSVAAVPPVGTAMQCEIEDPGAPAYAEQRVAFLPDLIERLRCGGSDDIAAVAFLTDVDAAMAHERSSAVWRGRLVQDGAIRYHPHSLRVAGKRLQEASPLLESAITTIHRAALDVSVPFHTGPGDTVIVSNKTALHYRGDCSVRFTRFPTEFDSRSLFVLHFRASIS